MTTVHDRRGGVHVATVTGTLTLPDARVLAAELDRCVTRETSHVVVDVLALEAAVDAALLMALLGVRNAMRRRAGRLTVVAAGERLDRLVRISAVDDLMAIVASLDEALDDRPGHEERVTAR
jgi:anti-anti-sigma regulatory factor